MFGRLGDKSRLLNWFESGQLIRPDSDHTNLIDLVHALANLSGSDQYVELAPNAERLASKIGSARHFVFILIDGLGMNILHLLNKKSFFKRHLSEIIDSVFPTTTASVLTCVATGKPASEHAVYGWWVYFPGQGISSTILPFQERYSKRPLEEAGVSSEHAFQTPSLLPSFKHKPFSVLPCHVAGSVYSQYAAGRMASYGYKNIKDGIDAVRKRICLAKGPTYNYLYFPQIDSLCHKKGCEAGRVRRTLLFLDLECKRLRNSLGNNSRIVISADHGLVNLPPDKEFILTQGDPLLDKLVCPPTGDGSTPVFHVKKGSEESFAEEFRKRFGKYFVLVSSSDAEELNLFGNGRFSSTMVQRIGTFIAISLEPAVLYFLPEGKSKKGHKAIHAGLRSGEMQIPLIIV